MFSGICFELTDYLFAMLAGVAALITLAVALWGTYEDWNQ